MAKILIVDDAPALVEFLSFLLKSRYYEVESASPKAEIEMKTPIFVPGIMLSDVKLNGEDGREVCHYIKTTLLNPHLPIVLFSAGPALLEGYKEYEAVDIIEKTFNMKAVLNKINNQLLFASD